VHHPQLSKADATTENLSRVAENPDDFDENS
jgi:hypothetical protein